MASSECDYKSSVFGDIVVKISEPIRDRLGITVEDLKKTAKSAGYEPIEYGVESPRDVGVYFLLRNGEIVYVGQSVDCRARVHTHKQDKTFDNSYIIKCSESALNYVEAWFIDFFKPQYNKNKNNRTFAGYSEEVELKRLLSITDWILCEQICSLMIKMVLSYRRKNFAANEIALEMRNCHPRRIAPAPSCIYRIMLEDHRFSSNDNGLFRISEKGLTCND